MLKGKKILIAAGKENVQREDVQDVLRCHVSLKEALLRKGAVSDTLFLTKSAFEKAEGLEKSILSYHADCIFNLFEGFSDDSQSEAEFVRILEDLNIPFTGNPSFALTICLNKEKTKKILNENKIPVPKGFFINRVEDLDKNVFSFPVFIKPCFEDASLGIDKNSLITEKCHLREILSRKLEEFPKGLIIEEFVPGKEYNVGFLGEFPYELLGISVLDYSRYEECSPFLTYGSKWEKESCEFKKLLPSLEEKLNEDLKNRIVSTAQNVGRVLKCRNYFRVDIREKNGEIFVLDVNPNPDINDDSGFMKQAYSSGYKYEDVIEKILCEALK